MKESFIENLTHLTTNPFQAKFLLAVSGGVDSCVMLHLFHSAQLSFDIAHCNFHLRQEASDKDALLVKELADRYHVKLFIKDFDTCREQLHSKQSIEMTARNLRYRWFAEIATDYNYIVTAHHANDNAETQLLNFTRGTGLKGLTGIPEKNGKIIRPLLSFSSQEIADYAAKNDIAYRDDETNFSEQYNRNKIRWSVIPKLEEINPRFIHTAHASADLLKRQYDFYKSRMDIIQKTLLLNNDYQYYIPIDLLLTYRQHAVLILYEILQPFHFNSDTVTQIIKSLNGISGKKFYSSTHSIVKDRNKLIISIIKQKKTELPVVIPDMNALRDKGFSVELKPFNNDIQYCNDPSILYADAEKLVFPLLIRNREDGDRFHPFGMRGQKKLSNFFIDNKINILDKKEIMLLCNNDNSIAWVVGYRSAEQIRIDKKTKQYYIIQYHGSI